MPIRFGFLPPSRKPTPSEYAVLVVFISTVFIVLGFGAPVVGFRAPAEEHGLAVELEYRGVWSPGIGLSIAIGYWFHRPID